VSPTILQAGRKGIVDRDVIRATGILNPNTLNAFLRGVISLVCHLWRGRKDYDGKNSYSHFPSFAPAFLELWGLDIDEAQSQRN